MTPEGWRHVTLGQIVAHLGRGTSPKYADAPSSLFAVNQKCVRNGRVTVEHARPHDPSASVKPDSLLRSDDLCVNSTGTGTIGRVGLWEPRKGAYFADTHITIVRPDTARVAPKFLCETLLAPWTQKEMEVTCFTGSTNQIELSKSAFSELALFLPPLGEQRKIAAILSSLDDAIEATQAVIDQLQVVKKAMMAELLTRGMPGRHTRFKKTEIGEIPEEWEVVLLDSVARRGSGHTPNKNHPEYWDGDIKWISLKDSSVLDRLYITNTAAKITSLGIANSSAVEHPAGTVVLSRDAGVGKSAITTDVMAVSQHFMAWVCGERLNNHFLYYLLQHWKPRFEHIAIGNTIKTIGLPFFKSLRVPVPTRNEQDRIAEALMTTDLRIFDETNFSVGMREIKSALMSVLLTGEVRVKPDEEVA